MCNIRFRDILYQLQSDPPGQRGHDAQGRDGYDQGEPAPLRFRDPGLCRERSPLAAQGRQGEDGEGEDDEVGGDVGDCGYRHGFDVVHGGAQLAVNIPISADGITPSREQGYV